MKYRADIDGLRALSVLMVLLFHAQIPKIKAGFIGVDIFFVISGFLITGVIIKALDRGDFSLLGFYQRRFLRLAPALIALVVVCYGLAFYFYLPKDLIAFSKSAWHALTYSANIHFANTTGGYFDAQSDYLLLLHTWSLGVEWQWYALLPIVLMALYRLIGRQWLVYGVVLVLGLAIIYSLYMSRGTAVTVHYYGLPSRAFELLMGAAITFIPYERIRLPQKLLSALGILCLLLIAVCLVESKVKIMFPNYYALLVSGCAALLIALGGVSQNNLATRFLSFKPLVFIGLISYSVYLWHWPIFAVLRYLAIDETAVITFVALGLSLLLGYLSWRFIEQKTRYLRNQSFMVIILGLFLIPAGIGFMLDRYIIKESGFIQRFDVAGLVAMEQTLYGAFAKGREACIDAPDLLGSTLCLSGDTEGYQARALVLGDSYVNQHWNFIDILAKDAHVAVESNTQTTCLMLEDIYLVDLVHLPKKPYLACRNLTDNLYEKLKAQPYDYVILGQVWSNYLVDKIVENLGDERSKALNFQRFQRAMIRSIETIRSTGARIIIFDETYIDQVNSDNKCFLKAIKTRTQTPNQCAITIEWDEKELMMKAFFATLKERYPELIFVDPKRVQCPDNVCLPTIEGIPVYGYGAHINDYAAKVFGQHYLAQFGNPFKPIPKRSTQ